MHEPALDLPMLFILSNFCYHATYYSYLIYLKKKKLNLFTCYTLNLIYAIYIEREREV